MISETVRQDVGEVDEGWWASILNEEESHQESTIQGSQKHSGHANPIKVDWDQVQAVFDQDEVVTLQVQGYNRGGLLVLGGGIQGFVPISHLIGMQGGIDEEARRDFLANQVGRMILLKIIECDALQERVVLSERSALAGEGRRKKLFQELNCGDLVTGTVTNVTEFGVFVDLGGIEGLIHVSELSWGRVHHPVEVLKVGQVVETMILQISEENSRVALSLKRLQINPWEVLVKRYKPGDVVMGTIASVMRFGAFAKLEEGVEGLIHISSVQMPPGIRDLEKLLTVGQEVSVKILHIDLDRRRLGLGLVNA